MLTHLTPSDVVFEPISLHSNLFYVFEGTLRKQTITYHAQLGLKCYTIIRTFIYRLYQVADLIAADISYEEEQHLPLFVGRGL